MRAGCGALKTKGDIPRARADPTPVHSHAHAIQPPPPAPRKAVVSATGMVDPDALVGTGKPPTAGARGEAFIIPGGALVIIVPYFQMAVGTPNGRYMPSTQELPCQVVLRYVPHENPKHCLFG